MAHINAVIGNLSSPIALEKAGFSLTKSDIDLFAQDMSTEDDMATLFWEMHSFLSGSRVKRHVEQILGAPQAFSCLQGGGPTDGTNKV